MFNNCYVVDIDECSTSTFACDPRAVCLNTIGSFACRCTNGFTGDGQTCNGGCHYFYIFQYDLPSCMRLRFNDDSFNNICNTIPANSYYCSTHFANCFIYECSFFSDINECLSPETFHCDPNASCRNTQGSYSCICNHGFTQNGDICISEL